MGLEASSYLKDLIESSHNSLCWFLVMCKEEELMRMILYKKVYSASVKILVEYIIKELL